MVPNPDDQEVGVMTTVSALVSGLDAELRRLGYKDATMVWYRGPVHYRDLRQSLDRGETQSPRSRLPGHRHQRLARMEPRPWSPRLARQPLTHPEIMRSARSPIRLLPGPAGQRCA